MKAKEAIKAIKDNMPTAGTYTMLTEALQLAIEVLEMQIPKDPINDSCAVCNIDVRNWTGDEEFKYCPECGQAVNWTEVDDEI